MPILAAARPRPRPEALCRFGRMKASIYLALATLFRSGNLVVEQSAVSTMTPLEPAVDVRAA